VDVDIVNLFFELLGRLLVVLLGKRVLAALRRVVALLPGVTRIVYSSLLIFFELAMKAQARRKKIIKKKNKELYLFLSLARSFS
jgi:hypothetical protein